MSVVKTEEMSDEFESEQFTRTAQGMLVDTCSVYFKLSLSSLHWLTSTFALMRSFIISFEKFE